MPWRRRRRRAVASIPGRAHSGRASERVRWELGGDLGQRGRIAAVRRIAVKLGSMMGPKKRIQGDSARKGSHTCGPCPSSHRQAQTNDAHIDSCRPARISSSTWLSCFCICIFAVHRTEVRKNDTRRSRLCRNVFHHSAAHTSQRRTPPKRVASPTQHQPCRPPRSFSNPRRKAD
jgi:hypothetical protein